MDLKAILDLLRHNILPSEAQRHAISQSLYMNRAPIGMNQAVNLTRETMTLLRSLLSPIRRMPTEILPNVFLDSAIHDHLSLRHRSGVVDRESPDVASVCHRWRSVILGTPAFWASIHPSSTAGPNCLSLLQLFIQRSQNTPLSIRLHVEASGRDELRSHRGNCGTSSPLD